MKRFFLGGLTALSVAAALVVGAANVFACTNLIVTKGASAENACVVTYTADSAGFFAKLAIVEASDGSFRPAGGSDVFPEGTPTYRVFGFCGETVIDEFQGIMNEKQVAIAETTFGGFEELQNKNGAKFMYPELMTAALQGAATAREAVELMGKLVDEHGYADVGESISVCDKNEAWIFEISGTGSTEETENKGCVWVAVRVPDGEITAHANQARIGVFPKNDPANCIYSKNVESFAIEKGLYDPKSGKPFSFCEAYGNIDITSLRACEKRVWSIFRRAAPSLNLSVDYAQGVEGAAPYPWSIKPDKKLMTADVAALMRDHYDGTEYDMSEGIDGGQFGIPMRCRPLYWEVDGKKYMWERPISTQQTCFSIITRSTADLPDAVGGLVWFGWDDTYTTCYSPIYAATTRIPASCDCGSIKRFEMKSGWWTFNFVANYAYPRYKEMIPEIKTVQEELETYFYRAQPAVERAATELAKTDEKAAVEFLTDYSVMQTEKARDRWETLANDLLVKFNDGYTRTDDGKYPNVGYPESWLRRVVEERGDNYRLPDEKKAESPKGVVGVVLCDGKPLAGADVKFFPKNESKNLFCFARTNKKGEYKLQTLLGKEDAPIPAGEYVVTVERVELVETGRMIVNADGEEAPETEERSLISERYRDPKTSGLSVTVAPEGGVFNFELGAE